MSGVWVFVCGPSGAGKDSVIRWASGQIGPAEGVVFARRWITRAPQPGSDHDPITPQRFAWLLGSGALSWAWEAHGHRYGIGSQYANAVHRGQVVVVNGSREHVSSIERSAQVRVVQIMADQDRLRQRLQERGREQADQVQMRLQRNALFGDLAEDLCIYNHGELAQAGGELVQYLRQLAHKS